MQFTRDMRGETDIHLVARWILEKNQEIQALEYTTDILENNIIDSMQFIEFVLFVEELRGRPIPMGEIAPESFSSLQLIEENFLQRI